MYKHFLNRALYWELASSPLTFQVLVHTKVQQATTTKKLKTCNFISIPPPSHPQFVDDLQCSQKLKTDSRSLNQALDWQIPCRFPHSALPGHLQPAIPTLLLSQCWKGCVTFNASAQMQVSADHELFIYVLILDHWSQQKFGYWLQWELDQKHKLYFQAKS